MIGTQECGASIETSIVMNFTGAWERSLIARFEAKQYQRIESSYLTAMHSILFVRNELAIHLSHVEKSYVPTGFADVIGNKGGLGISFNLGRTSFLFISSHFHAFQDKVELRNSDYHKIEKKLPMRREKNAAKEYCSSRFDRVFWAGDLNYRCLNNRAVADTLLRENNIGPLLNNEQLIQQMRQKKVFEGYQEAEIKFRPTYKFDVGSNTYDTSEKLRVPSWTDRILWRPNPHIECIRYDSTPSIRTSDHKPVYAIFRVIALKEDEEARNKRLNEV
eukprot:CAMPEP_0167829064 /NCGR_PEP_ID=MMETSP0112_2-20121227/11894_1 /TAXON_ID=91324 /ORGANISM="Lotharella globosa, Strain CCCM811" /LENGTH=275 /DNA_ID=CAMNT_0007732601 /DNA_START=15 /DNA_END=839 /DNA_ORIENTATION=-